MSMTHWLGYKLKMLGVFFSPAESEKNTSECTVPNLGETNFWDPIEVLKFIHTKVLPLTHDPKWISNGSFCAATHDSED